MEPGYGEGRAKFKQWVRHQIELAVLTVTYGKLWVSKDFKIGYWHQALPQTHENPSLADIMYHIFRCELAHNDSVPDDIKWTDQPVFSSGPRFGGYLVLPIELLRGFAAAVVAASCNAGQKLDHDFVMPGYGGAKAKLSSFWGKRQELLDHLSGGERRPKSVESFPRAGSREIIAASGMFLRALKQEGFDAEKYRIEQADQAMLREHLVPLQSDAVLDEAKTLMLQRLEGTPH